MFEDKLTREMVKAIHQPREKQKPTVNKNVKAKGLTTTLAEYIPSELAPWNKKRVFHVLRRLQFGVNYSEIEPLLGTSPTLFIDSLIDGSITSPMPDVPVWVNDVPPWNEGDQAILDYFENNYFTYIEYQREWTDLMKVYPFREKMVLFWHNHFVTEVGKYEYAPLAYRYFTTLRTHALGNFKDFVHAIGIDSAMLYYLDGIENRVGSPNENYARELLELFTMGIGNYSEDDIREMARALTGYWFNWGTLTSHFSNDLHDWGEKTFFGRTGNFGYDDVIDIIFEEREQEIAEFVCRKLYKFFVYETPNESIVQELAQTFINNNFEIAPVLRLLLKSEHFFDEAFLGAMFKSPTDYLVGLQKETGVEIAGAIREWQPYQLFELGQFLFNPVNVAGWPGYRSWISTTTLPYRWNHALTNLYYNDDDYEVDPIEIANAMSEPNDPYQLAYDLAEYMLAVDLREQDLQQLPVVLLGGIPDYEWNIYISGANWRILALMAHIRQLPEYQLM